MKKIVFFSLLALLSFDINAKNASEDSITTKNSFVVTRFKSNWFLNFGANANVYLGQNDSKLDFGKRIAPGFTISAGKWVTPWLYNPQIEMFARFKMKSSFHKTKRII